MDGIAAGTFQILSLDGGGIRGVFSAAVLAAVEDDCGVRITDHFDLIAGTSTGGILALGLGLGLRPRELVEFYVEFGPRIFPRRRLYRDLLHWFRRKYSQAELESALKNKFGDRPLGTSSLRLIVPAFNLGENAVHVFRTAHLERLRRDYKIPAWKVAMATSAAPTYFRAFTLDRGVRLVDGGVWANNPAMVAYIEATAHLGVAADNVSLLSLGTISALRSRRESLDEAGKFAWAKEISEVLLDASSLGVSNHVKSLLRDRYLRIDPIGHATDLRLDSSPSVDDLIGKASHVSRETMPLIREKFLQHRAAPFVPFHTP